MYIYISTYICTYFYVSMSFINQRKSELSTLRDKLGANLPKSPEYDDIFLLRYLLSWEKRGGLKEVTHTHSHTHTTYTHTHIHIHTHTHTHTHRSSTMSKRQLI